MIQCWQMAPEDRPTFKELYSSVSQSIERDAGYLQFGFNPFTGGGREGGGGDGEDGEGEGGGGDGEEGEGVGGGGDGEEGEGEGVWVRRGGEGEGERQGEEDGKEGQEVGSGVSIKVIPPSLGTNGKHTFFSNPLTD